MADIAFFENSVDPGKLASIFILQIHGKTWNHEAVKLAGIQKWGYKHTQQDGGCSS